MGEELFDAFVLRNALAPYIYTEARKAFDSSVPFLHSMYIDYQTYDEAYNATHQYFFGDFITVAPISSMVDPATNTTQKTMWIPPGEWISWDGFSTETGPTQVTNQYTQREIPMYVPAGTMIALKQPDMSNVQTVSPDLIWTIWPGSQTGSTYIYEDDGVSLDYQSNAGAITNATYYYDDETLVITVTPTTGTFNGQPQTRSHWVQLRGWTGSTYPTVTVNGASPYWYIVSAEANSLAAPTGSLVVTDDWRAISDTVIFKIKG